MNPKGGVLSLKPTYAFGEYIKVILKAQTIDAWPGIYPFLFTFLAGLIARDMTGSGTWIDSYKSQEGKEVKKDGRKIREAKEGKRGRKRGQEGKRE